MPLQHAPDSEAAHTIALQALAFLASDGERLGRFLALTGMGPAELKAQAGDTALLQGVLDHLMRDESLLLVFASDAGLKPEQVAAAFHALGQVQRARGRHG